MAQKAADQKVANQVATVASLTAAPGLVQSRSQSVPGINNNNSNNSSAGVGSSSMLGGALGAAMSNQPLAPPTKTNQQLEQEIKIEQHVQLELNAIRARVNACNEEIAHCNDQEKMEKNPTIRKPMQDWMSKMRAVVWPKNVRDVVRIIIDENI